MEKKIRPTLQQPNAANTTGLVSHLLGICVLAVETATQRKYRTCNSLLILLLHWCTQNSLFIF
jgi:hypothetical protein